jgi:hypothetical protein
MPWGTVTVNKRQVLEVCMVGSLVSEEGGGGQGWEGTVVLLGFGF